MDETAEHKDSRCLHFFLLVDQAIYCEKNVLSNTIQFDY